MSPTRKPPVTPALLLRRPARTADRPPPAATPPAHAPDWSEGTLDLLARLSPLERAFVEWLSTGMSSAAAYRKAAGRDPGPARDASRQQAYKLRARPRVRAAIQACLGDRNLAARVDREAILGKLIALIEACEDSARPRDRRILVAALAAAARLQGYLPGRPPPPPPPAARATAATGAARRLDALILRAEQAIAQPAAGARADAGDDAQAGGRPPGARAGGSGPPEVVGVPLTAADGGNQLDPVAGRVQTVSGGYLATARRPFLGVG